jgi:hypothetical protein
METILLDTLGRLYQHGHGMFGWCTACGSALRYWADLKAGRNPQPSIFDIDIAVLIRERSESSSVVGMAPARCPRCGSLNTETRITAPAKIRQ